MQENTTSLYDSLYSINREISIKKMDIRTLESNQDKLLLELAKKHYHDLMSLEKGTLKNTYSYYDSSVQFKTSYDAEKKIYYFQGALFYQNDIIQNVKIKLATIKRGNKTLGNMSSGFWYIENISKDEISIVNEVIKYELDTRLINGNLINKY